MFKKYIKLFLLIFLCFNVEANNQRFSYLTSHDGISQSEVYCFLEDSRGFMWFGTLDGLNRYDGYEIKIFNIDFNNPNSLSNNTIRSLVEDKHGRIWIGTDDGLNYYDPLTEQIHQISISTDKRKMTIWTLLTIDDQLFIGTEYGLWRTTIESLSINEIHADLMKVRLLNYTRNEDSPVRNLIKSKMGGIWIQSSNSISRIVFQKHANAPIVIDDFEIDRLQAITEDMSSNLWIASNEKGLAIYNPSNKQLQFVNKKVNSFFPFSQRCSSLTVDNNGNIWVGTLDMGLLKITFDYPNQVINHIESIKSKPAYNNSLNSNLIYSLYTSSNNILWVGTIGAGINIYNPGQKKFNHYVFKNNNPEGPKSNFIRALNITKEKNILIGTHNNGLFIFNRKSDNYIKLGFENHSVFYIANYEKDKYFICTSKGLYLVKLIGDKIRILSEYYGANNEATFYVLESKKDILWCATLFGLVRLRVNDNVITLDKVYTEVSTPAISTNNCRVLYYDDAKQELLIGTEGGGLNIMALDKNHYPTNVMVFHKNPDTLSLSNNYIRTIIKDKKNNIWIGTYEGLNKMISDSSSVDKKFRVFTKTDGLPNNMIELIVEDGNELWIGTNGGLSRFIPDEKRFINFTVADGLQSNEFSEHTSFKSSDGEIILGGINGITSFFPSQITLNDLKPKTTITDFYLYNKKINVHEEYNRLVPLKKSIVLTDTIVLSPKNKNLGFRFSAMIYPNADKVRYAYMLEGFDERWNYTDANNRIANYTNLRHGKYTFLVKSTNSDGIWEDSPRKIYIHILTPFKYTWAAFIMYFLVFVFSIVYFSHYTVIRYTTKNKLILENEHSEKLHKLDEMRTRFFINISHDLRTPLTLIKGPLEMLLKNKNISEGQKENLSLIKRNVKRLNYLVEQLLDIRKSESGKLTPKKQLLDLIAFTNNELLHFNYAIKQKKLRLNCNYSEEVLMTYFDPAMISKVYFNIIANAIKFTCSGEINVNIRRTERIKSVDQITDNNRSCAVVEIQDTGIGMSESKQKRLFERFYQDQNQSGNGYGIGLSHTKELIEAHNGYIEAESEKNVGTVIRFFLPDIEINKELINIEKSNKKIVTSAEDIFIDTDANLDTIEQNKPVNQFEKTVLIVEDNNDMLSFIKKGLDNIYNVLQAQNGIEGLKIAENKNPDLIVSDIMMPQMDGIELCEKIKTNINTSHVPIILLTAKVDLETKYESIETGADDYIPKPFEMEYLLIRIKNLLDSRDKLRKIFQKDNILKPSEITVTSIDEKFLSKFIEEIEKGLTDSEFSINSLESKLGMSHSSFYRKIKNLTGQSAQEVLQVMRMKRAHKILSENKGVRVSEVAYMVGFTDPKYFARCYKEIYGHSPSHTNKKVNN